MKKVLAAMSGGLDSSVAAALLKRDNYDVEGAFMRLTDLPASREAEKRAKEAARVLSIPFYVFDFQKEFREIIIGYFLDGYRKGITPNPCVLCNKRIKFGLFLKKAREMGMDYVATGHYARLEGGKLMKAKDRENDQTYFLWMLEQGELKRILFPIGRYKREEVRKMAEGFHLDFLLDIKKSTGICFIPESVSRFLKERLKPEPGLIMEEKSPSLPNPEPLGRHQGLAFYAIGQREGIFLPDGPWYVTGKDSKRNVLLVSKKERSLYRKELVAEDVNWISGERPNLPLKIRAKIRYRHPSVPAILQKAGRGRYRIVFSSGQRAITPGQSVVFYLRQELLGGGIISVISPG